MKLLVAYIALWLIGFSTAKESGNYKFTYQVSCSRKFGERVCTLSRCTTSNGITTCSPAAEDQSPSSGGTKPATWQPIESRHYKNDNNFRLHTTPTKDGPYNIPDFDSP